MDTKQVWKFPIPLNGGANRINAPADGKVVFAGRDGHSEFCVWIEVDPFAPMPDRTFQWHGTGHEIPKGWEHRATTIDGPFVWHLYEEPRLVNHGL